MIHFVTKQRQNTTLSVKLIVCNFFIVPTFCATLVPYTLMSLVFNFDRGRNPLKRLLMRRKFPMGNKGRRKEGQSERSDGGGGRGRHLTLCGGGGAPIDYGWDKCDGEGGGLLLDVEYGSIPDAAALYAKAEQRRRRRRVAAARGPSCFERFFWDSWENEEMAVDSRRRFLSDWCTSDWMPLPSSSSSSSSSAV